MTLHCKRRAFASTANICSVWRNGAILRRWRKADMVWLPNDKTFDGSEKNEITSLTSWEITLSLTHTRTQILVFTHPLCPSQHIKTERRLGNESTKLLNEYQNAAAAWFHLRATLGAKEIDGRTFISKMSGIWGGAEAKSSVADYSCLCVSVFPAHFQHLTEISVSYTTVWEALSLPFSPRETQATQQLRWDQKLVLKQRTWPPTCGALVLLNHLTTMQKMVHLQTFMFHVKKMTKIWLEAVWSKVYIFSVFRIDFQRLCFARESVKYRPSFKSRSNSACTWSEARRHNGCSTSPCCRHVPVCWLETFSFGFSRCWNDLISGAWDICISTRDLSLMYSVSTDVGKQLLQTQNIEWFHTKD